ncbi:MAG: hypothetical protein ACM37W_13795 [Actinomycetota bacterium]
MDLKFAIKVAQWVMGNRRPEKIPDFIEIFSRLFTAGKIALIRSIRTLKIKNRADACFPFANGMLGKTEIQAW